MIVNKLSGKKTNEFSYRAFSNTADFISLHIHT